MARRWERGYPGEKRSRWMNLDPLIAVILTMVVAAGGAISRGCSSDASQRIKIARPSVRWLSSAESHERANAVRSLLRLWLPGDRNSIRQKYKLNRTFQ